MEGTRNDKGYNFIFPGVGTDYRRYIKQSKLDQDPEYLERCGFAKELSGIDIIGYVNGKEVDDPVLTAWCCAYTVDGILYGRLRKAQIEPKYMAGYSMGLNTALQCAGAIAYLDGINILKINRALKSTQIEETMVGFIGWEYEQVSQLIKESQCMKKAYIACENNPYCFILSGERGTLDELSEKAQAQGIYKIAKLDIDYAFHTDFYREKSKRLESYVNQMAIKQPNIPIVSVIDQKWIRTEDEVREELVRNLYSGMKWLDTVNMIMDLDREKKNKFIEVSLSDSLTKASRILGSKSRFITYDAILKRQEEQACIKTR